VPQPQQNAQECAQLASKSTHKPKQQFAAASSENRQHPPADHAQTELEVAQYVCQPVLQTIL